MVIEEPRLIELTQDLVRAPSVLGTEAEVVRRLVAAMGTFGFDRVGIDEMGNAIGMVEGAGEGPTLLFDAHMDTVDVQPLDAWSRDPFSGELHGGRIHGRGASDMKGALAAMVCAAAALDRSRLAGRVIVTGSVEEERIEGVALEYICRRHRPDMVVIGEASNLDLVRAGRGRAELAVQTRGRPSHASTPQQGIHAVHRMIGVVAEIESLPRAEHPFVGRGVMCLTDIISDPYPAHSVVPSGCRATYERRLVPGESKEAVLSQVRSACQRADAADTKVDMARAELRTHTGYRIDREKWLPPWELAAGHALVQTALAGLRSIGLSPALASYGFCTNAAFSAGEAGIPTIGFGPGREELVHITDEYVEVAQLEAASRGYRAIAESLLSR